MSIYVSDVIKSKRDPTWHPDFIAFMFCENRLELHDFAYAIGVSAVHFINDPHFPCYKLTQTQRYKAINKKAIPKSLSEFNDLIKTSTACAEVQHGT